ncbi:hypothetical protein F4782DRAFT_549708 [Xylaria castorea]|nr:hypothetical protein F4782DRAFT_549708 [Xylaria castorea]
MPRKEELGALRIFGSAERGFGTLPNVIEVLLTRAGLIYLVLPDDMARVPEYWMAYYKQHNPATTKPPAEVIPNTDSEEDPLESEAEGGKPKCLLVKESTNKVPACTD